MYPLSCKGGFNVPARAGKHTIVGISAAVNDLSSDSEIAIVDDGTIDKNSETGKIIQDMDDLLTDNTRRVLAHLKGSGTSQDGVLEWFPGKNIMTRHGISLYVNNLRINSICVYVE